jgi:acyl-CoA thioesterase
MDIKEFIRNDRFASLIGIELIDAEEGRAKAKLDVREEHLNAVGIAHGGLIFSLADLAFAAASNSYGNIAVAINANISYFKASGKGVLFAEAKEISKSNRLATYGIKVTNVNGDLIASFQGTVFRKDKKQIEDDYAKYIHLA